MFAAGDDLADHQVWHVEACRLDAPYLWSVPDEQDHSHLRSDRIRCSRRKAHHVLPKPVVAIGLVGDLGLIQYHEVEATDLYHLDGLCEPKILSVTNVEGPDG